MMTMQSLTLLKLSDINFPVEWKENDDPLYPGQHLVAVRYPTGFGSYDFATWNGNEWELGYQAEVVGWVPINDVFSVLKAGWPKGDSEVDEERKKNRSQDDDSEPDFVEVE